MLRFALATYGLESWLGAVLDDARSGGPIAVVASSIFYIGLFTATIFTDVLSLIVSMQHPDRYELVFRDAGFVISTIRIRISLTTPKPFNLGLANAAIVFGILVLLIHSCSGRIRRTAPGTAATSLRAPDVSRAPSVPVQT